MSGTFQGRGYLPSGGTTGQVATKRSNSNLDVDWETSGGGGGGSYSSSENIVSGHTPVLCTPDSTVALRISHVTTGGTGGVEIIELPNLPLDANSNNLPGTWQKHVIVCDVLTNPADVPKVRLNTGDTLVSYEADGRVGAQFEDGANHSLIPINGVGEYATFIWVGGQWMLDQSAFNNNGSFASTPVREGSAGSSTTPDQPNPSQGDNGRTFFQAQGADFIFNLPPASASTPTTTPGFVAQKLKYTFINVSAHKMTLQAQGGDKIVGVGGLTSSANGTLQCDGSVHTNQVVTVEAYSSIIPNQWTVTAMQGTFVAA